MCNISRSRGLKAAWVGSREGTTTEERNPTEGVYRSGVAMEGNVQQGTRDRNGARN